MAQKKLMTSEVVKTAQDMGFDLRLIHAVIHRHSLSTFCNAQDLVDAILEFMDEGNIDREQESAPRDVSAGEDTVSQLVEAFQNLSLEDNNPHPASALSEESQDWTLDHHAGIVLNN